MVPVGLPRVIAEKAGVHCYSSTVDIVWASKNLLAVSVNRAGERTIHLAEPHCVRNLWSGEILMEMANRINVNLGEHETLLLRLD